MSTYLEVKAVRRIKANPFALSICIWYFLFFNPLYFPAMFYNVFTDLRKHMEQDDDVSFDAFCGIISFMYE